MENIAQAAHSVIFTNSMGKIKFGNSNIIKNKTSNPEEV